MNWNADKVKKFYYQESERINPMSSKECPDLFDYDLAKKNFFRDCSMYSTSREEFVDFLTGAMTVAIISPKEVYSEEKYKEHYVSFAKRTLYPDNIGVVNCISFE